MNTFKLLFIIPILLAATLLTGCRRSPNMVWEDSKSAGRHVNRGFRSLGGKHGDSRQIRSRNEFMCENDLPPATYAQESEFVPLQDCPGNNGISMSSANRPPRETPGDPGSSIPGIEAFRDPSTNPRWSGVFRNVYFDYNSSLIKGSDSLATIRNVAEYMREHPNTSIFVEGHCDERGPEAYNLVLGSHRSNAIRNLLINDGVNPDAVFTISYGKERPIISGPDEESWQQNRRAEFKVYER